MAHKYTYPIVDSALRNFLLVVLISLAIVTVAVAIAPWLASLELLDLLLPGLRAIGENPFLMSSIRGVPWDGVWID